MQERKQRRRGILIRRLLCAAAAAGVIAGLAVAAAASQTEAYKTTYDKYSDAAEHKEQKFAYSEDSGTLKEVQTYVYNEDGAQMKDDKGEWVKVSLTKDVDYSVMDAEEGHAQVVLKDTYLDSLYNLPYTFFLSFTPPVEAGEIQAQSEIEAKVQKWELTIQDSTPEEPAEEPDQEVASEEPDQEVAPEEDTAQAEGTESEAKTDTGEDTGIMPMGVGAYDVTMSSNTMAADDTTFGYTEAESNGTLTVNLNLQSTGETGRYVIVKMPEYGMVLGTTLPGTGQGVTKVTKQNERTLRLDIADTVDETLNIGISYIKKSMSLSMEMAWRAGTVPPATGFTTTIYGKVSGTEQELATASYGNWQIDTGSHVTDLWTIASLSDAMINSEQATISNNLKDSTIGKKIVSSVPAKLGSGSAEHLAYVKSIKLYGDPKVLQIYIQSGNGPQIGYNNGIPRGDYAFDNTVKTDAKGSYIEGTLRDGSVGVSNMGTHVALGEQFSIVWEETVDYSSYGLAPDTEYPVTCELTVGQYTNGGVVEYTIDTPVQKLVTRKLDTIDGKGTVTYTSWKRDDASAKLDSNRVYIGQDFTTELTRFHNSSYWDDTTEYMVADKMENFTETFEFPYEIQPNFMYFQNAEMPGQWTIMSALPKVSYVLSDGSTKTAVGQREKKWTGAINYEYSFEVPEGLRVTKATIVWDEYSQIAVSLARKNNMSIPWIIDGKVALTKEDGTTLADDNYKAVVKSTKTLGDGTVFAESNVNQLCFYFRDQLQTCPTSTWTKNYNYNSDMKAKVANNNTTYVNDTPIQVGRMNAYSAPKYVLRDTLENPKLTLRYFKKPEAQTSTYAALDGTAEELAGYFFTGKMKVYPTLAGWTVTYHTRDKGAQTLTLPESIPAEGYELILPVEDSDRLVGYTTGSSLEGVAVAEFSKSGEVAGWRGAEGTTLINDVEFYYPQDSDDGTSLDVNGVAGNLYGYGLHDSVLTSDSCPLDEKDGYNNIKRHTHESPTYSVGENGGRFFARAYKDVLTVMNRGDSASSAAAHIYQDSSAQVIAGGTLNFNRDTSSYNFNGGTDYMYNYGVTKGAFGGAATSIYKELKPVIYAKLSHDNLTYMGADATIKISSLDSGILGKVYKSYNVPAQATLIAGNDGSKWLKIEAERSQVVEVRQIGSDIGARIEGITSLYAFPGAVLGTGQVFSEVYIDEQFDQWENTYDGSKEKDYVTMTVEDREADVLDLQGTGDTTSPSLYHYDVDVKTEVLQKVLTGIRIAPGVDSSYEMDTREKEFYPNKQNNLTALMTISADNDNLTNYKAVFELPETGKGILGRFIGSSAGDITATSEFTASLRGGVIIQSDTTGVTPTYRYRIAGTWYTQAQMEASGNWDQVQAIEVFYASFPKNSSVTLGVELAAEDKTNADDLKGYIGGTFEYTSSGGGGSNGTLTFGTYVYHPYIIKGNVFKDIDESGLKNGSEKGMEGITVALKSNNEEDPLVTTTTDASGNYVLATTESRWLYLEITMPDGHKLTKNSEDTAEVSNQDSDFDRDTNLYEEFPNRLGEGVYQIDAGIVKLPTLTASDITVRMEEPVAGNAAATWEKGAPTIHYEEAADTGIATVAPTGAANAGTVTPVAIGNTTATVWVENSLGDRVEVTYNITVVPREVEINLTKQLTEVADSDYTFVFKIEKLSDDETTVERVFYQALKIPQGNSSASASIRKLMPGKYRFTEVDSNWRYNVVGNVSSVVDAVDPDNAGSVTYVNSRTVDRWVSGNASVTNTMNHIAP